MREAILGLALAVLSPFAVPIATTANAQEPPPEQPAATEAPQPASTPVPEASEPAGDADVTARYEAAFRALIEGKHAEALAGFEAVSAQSQDGVQIAVSQELIRFLREKLDQESVVDLSDTSAEPAGGEPYNAAKLPSDVRKARAVLVSGWTTTGLAGYSWMVPLAVGAQGDAPGIGLGMLTASASFLGPYLLTRKDEVSYGEAGLSSHGLFAGVAHAGLIAAMTNMDPQPMAGLMFVTSVAEGTGGFFWARHRFIDSGEAHLIATGDYAGMLAGVGIAFGFGIHKGSNDDGVFALALLGGVGGIAGATALIPHRSYTWGDVQTLRTSALLGLAIAGIPLAWLDQPEDQAIAWVLLTGGAAGLVFGDQLALGDDFTAGQGVILELATVAGAATGLGVSLLLFSDAKSAGQITYTMSAVTATAAFVLAHHNIRKWDSDTAPRAMLLPIVTPDLKGLALQATF